MIVVMIELFGIRRKDLLYLSITINNKYSLFSFPLLLIVFSVYL